MSTADKAEKQGGHAGAWANLIVCGGISWAVSLWHATHPEKGTHPNTALALLIATAPIVTSAFGSHNIAKRGGGWARMVMTILVFAMGMALSIRAQAQSVGPFVGGTELGVVFALMLDFSTFLALSSLMAKPAEKRPPKTDTPPAAPPVEAPAGPPVGAPVTPPADRLSTAWQAPVQAPAGPPVKAPAAPPAERPKRPRQATAAKAPQAKKMTPEEVKAKAWELLKNNPEMSAPELARHLGKSPTSGHVRDLKAKVLGELADAGEIERLRAVSQ